MADQNYLLHLENSIKERYGEAAIKNPKANWTKEKEESYLQQVKELHLREQENEKSIEHININGALVSPQLVSERNKRICSICGCYSLKRADDLYLTKFDACYKCYVEFIEDREDKWKQKRQSQNKE